MKRIIITCVFIIAGIASALPQDIIVLKTGDEVEAKVTEIGIEQIKYKKHSMPDGPDYVCLKSEVFMIKYENGSREVFGDTASAEAPRVASAEEGSATLFFLRPKKFSASRPEIIVGTMVPDEVILKLKNGHWHRLEYSNLGSVDFVVGIYAVNPESLQMDLRAGERYYFYCEPYEQGFTLMGSIREIDRETAELHMSELKEQADSLAD